MKFSVNHEVILSSPDQLNSLSVHVEAKLWDLTGSKKKKKNFLFFAGGCKQKSVECSGQLIMHGGSL